MFTFFSSVHYLGTNNHYLTLAVKEDALLSRSSFLWHPSFSSRMLLWDCGPSLIWNTCPHLDTKGKKEGKTKASLVDPHWANSWHNRFCCGLSRGNLERWEFCFPIHVSRRSSSASWYQRWAVREARWRATTTCSSSSWWETVMWAKERSWTACRTDLQSPLMLTVVVSHSCLSWSFSLLWWYVTHYQSPEHSGCVCCSVWTVEENTMSCCSNGLHIQ